MNFNISNSLSLIYDFHLEEIVMCDLKVKDYHFKLIAIANIRNMANSHYKIIFQFEPTKVTEEYCFYDWEEAVTFLEDKIKEKLNE